jgi:hypothetical protein
LIADVPRVKLSELVGRFGTGLSGDARRSKALLADMCGDRFRGERAVLVAAVEEGIAGELLSSSSGLPKEMLLNRLSHRLEANRGVSSDLARWSVECWAVALGLVAGDDALVAFKMEGLAPLIQFAGTDGRISAAELDHLILEAKTRGVSEANARAYLSDYAAAQGWQLGKPPARSGRARAKAVPQPPPPPRSPQPQFRPPTPRPVPSHPQSSALRWIVATVIASIVIITVVVKVNQAPQLPAPPPIVTPTPAPPVVTPPPETKVPPAPPLGAPLPSVSPAPIPQPAIMPAPAPNPLQPEGRPDLQGKVTRIFAAEEIIVDGQPIRLCGIQDNGSTEPQLRAHADWMVSQIGQSSVSCYRKGYVGGKAVYRCYKDGKNLADLAIGAGIASPRPNCS